MTELQVVFKCPVCQSAITLPLLKLPPDREINLKDGEIAVPKGYYALSDDEYWTGSEGCPLVNLDDMRNFRYHPDPHRHNGCCGRDGLDGPNLICFDGHEVGTEKTDCWMSHAVVLLQSVVKSQA